MIYTGVYGGVCVCPPVAEKSEARRRPARV